MTKPTVPKVLPAVEALYTVHAAGCCLHIVLDDCNVDDDSVRYCVDNAKHDFCRKLGRVLLLMSKTQRTKLQAIHRVGAYAGDERIAVAGFEGGERLTFEDWFEVSV